MSMYLEFEPHSWYMGFAIKNNRGTLDQKDFGTCWTAYTDNGNTYPIDELEATTLTELKQQIRRYHIRHKNGYGERLAKRLEVTA